MTRYNKTYIRRVRAELDRFPSFPLQLEVELGDLFKYHGRYGRYEKHGNLSELGIHITPTGAQTLINETHESASGMTTNLKTDLGFVAADFQFGRKSGLVTGSFDQAKQSLPIQALNKALNALVQEKPDIWKGWLIVTELWTATGFTVLMAGNGGAQVVVKTGIEIPEEAFHIADPKLKLGLSLKKNMHYTALAKEGIHPFFQLSSFVKNRGGRELRVYAGR